MNVDKPCIRKCCLNEDDVCLGCFRTFDDMCQWHKTNRAEKIKMLQMAELRKKEHAVKFSFFTKNSS